MPGPVILTLWKWALEKHILQLLQVAKVRTPKAKKRKERESVDTSLLVVSVR